jgi:hypothetical protein
MATSLLAWQIERTTHFSALNADAALNADEKSKLSTPDIDERHFSTLNADKKSKFSTPDVDEKQQATSLLAWQIDKKQVKQ